jgi:hypothetical protein
MPSDPRIERLDEEVAAVLRAKSGAERLQIASRMFAAAARMLASQLAVEHPDWSPERIQVEVARRIAGGPG